MFVSFVVAMLATMALIPLLMRASARLRLVDEPGPRKVHAQSVPRVGGIAILVGLLLPTLAFQVAPRPILGILVGVLIVVAEGVWDDRVTLGYRQKFAGQILAALAVIGIGDIQIREIVFWNEILLPEWISFPLTLVVIVALTNAVNLADGLDGLAGGVSFLGCAALALLAYASGNSPALLLCIALCGALVGFLRFNTFPARVFMGDGGSQLLGLTIASLAIHITQSENALYSASTPLFLLALPILDTLFVMVQRIREGRSPFSADRNHLHHRLLALGLGHGQAVALIYFAQCLLLLLAYVLRYESDLLNLLVFAGVGVLMLITLVRRDTQSSAPAHFVRRGRQVFVADSQTQEVLRQLAIQVLVLSLVSYCLSAAIFLDVPSDLGATLMFLLAVLVVTALPQVARAVPLIARCVVYVLAAVLAYLFVEANELGAEVARFETTLVVMIAISTVAALRFSEKLSFSLNAMDLLVLFTAIVIPNLPGLEWSDVNLPALAARLAVMFYALEFLLSTHLRQIFVSHVTAALTLAILIFKAIG